MTAIEIQEKVMPEPIELLPMKRPNTEDFLTFLCFRGTPALPQSLSFFNNAAMTEGPPPISESPGSSKNGVILPANIGKAQGDKPFIAFGVRKRADPVVVSRHMDKKRRHALALQALRRKYQEQKMAKIRAITISKLSEKVHTNKTVVRTTRSITKAEPVTKKNVAQKTKITVVATKHVKVTTRRSSIQQTNSTANIKQKMTLRNLRNRVVKREIKKIANTKGNIKENLKNKNSIKAVDELEEEEVEEEEENQEDEEDEDDEEYSTDNSEESQEETPPQKKLPERKNQNLRVTRSNILQNKRILIRQQNLKGSPTSPRLRSQLRRKILQGKTELNVPKRRILTRKVQIKTKTIAKKVQTKTKDKVEKSEKSDTKADVKVEAKESPGANTRENVRKKQEILNSLKKDAKTKRIIKGKVKVEEDKPKVIKKIEANKKTEEKTKKLPETKVKKEKIEDKDEANKKSTNKSEKNTPDEKSKKEETPEKKVKKTEKKTKDTKKVTDDEKPKESPILKKTPAKKADQTVNVKSPVSETKNDTENKTVSSVNKSNKSIQKQENSSIQEKPEKVTNKKNNDDKLTKNVKAKEPKEKEKLDIDKTDISKIPILPIIENNKFIVGKGIVIEEIAPFKPVPEIKQIEKLTEKCDKVENAEKIDKPLSPKFNKKVDKVEKKEKQEKQDKTLCEKVDKTPTAKKVSDKSNETCDKVEKKTETSTIRERPARKTKLAAAIYMEILGRKLVNDDDVDNMSIDSFPELPNVRKMEQRENELKLKAKMKTTAKKAANSPAKVDKTEKIDKLDKKRKDCESETETTKSKPELLDKTSSKSLVSPKNQQGSPMKNSSANFSDSDSEKLILKKLKKQKLDAAETVQAAPKKTMTKKKTKKLDDTFSFSESDEEPLVKLTQKASENEKSKSEAESTVKQKRECAKRPQNYLPLFSSSDEEEKFFKNERPLMKKKVAKTEVPAAAQEVLLSSKDIGKRYVTTLMF